MPDYQISSTEIKTWENRIMHLCLESEGISILMETVFKLCLNLNIKTI